MTDVLLLNFAPAVHYSSPGVARQVKIASTWFQTSVPSVVSCSIGCIYHAIEAMRVGVDGVGRARRVVSRGDKQTQLVPIAHGQVGFVLQLVCLSCEGGPG